MRSKAAIRFCTILTAAATAFVLGAISASAGILTSPSLTGAEIAATETQGTFVGTAVDHNADLAGVWAAVVDHSSLSPCSGVNQACAWVTGGTFTLQAVQSRHRVTIKGTFDSATAPTATDSITPTELNEPCGTEKFVVTDTLSNVLVNGAGATTGTFSVLLTHYRISVLGHCITYAATVVGNATIS